MYPNRDEVELTPHVTYFRRGLFPAIQVGAFDVPALGSDR